MHRTLALCAFAAQAAVLAPTFAQNKSPNDDAVGVTALRNPVDKSYRRMVEGMELFEKRHRLAPDNTFTLERRAAALKENASVRPNRKAKTMTWRAEIRTPGLPPDTRRLGDLRLECEVGMQAGLISNYRPLLFGLLDPFLREGPEYCRRTDPRYLFFAERPLFGVTLVAGDRSEALPVERLYGGASRDSHWKDELPYCDCEVLMDRAYFMPLGDSSWPDDTLVKFDYMDARP